MLGTLRYPLSLLRLRKVRIAKWNELVERDYFPFQAQDTEDYFETTYLSRQVGRTKDYENRAIEDYLRAIAYTYLLFLLLFVWFLNSPIHFTNVIIDDCIYYRRF